MANEAMSKSPQRADEVRKTISMHSGVAARHCLLMDSKLVDDYRFLNDARRLINARSEWRGAAPIDWQLPPYQTRLIVSISTK